MRALFALAPCLVALAACSGPAPPASATSAPPSASSAPPVVASSAPAPVASAAVEGPWEKQVVTWDYADSAVGKTSVVIVSPRTDRRLPVLVTLHGLGEAEKGPARGARGWIDDYGLLHALERIEAPPLTQADMLGLGTREQLDALNAQLAAQRYRGMVVVCPYTPNILGSKRPLDGAEPLGRFLVEEVLPRVVRELPALDAPAATGIDGVSLGGRAALLAGMEHAERFGVVASMQAAIYAHELDALADRAAAARADNPAVVLRLLTSSADFYHDPLNVLSKRLTKRGIAHSFEVIDRGPHSYEFNRGLGVFHMLAFHDAALLRGER
jgi:hypothetical protein